MIEPGPEPPARHTFLFADLAGYTALTEAHGDEQAADAAAEFCDSVRALLDDHDAQEVKAIGDALMIRAPRADDAARLAEHIVCGYGARHRALGIRVGMHTGTAVRRGDDWFGSAVNLASRVADQARAGEVLLTQATRDELAEPVAVRPRGRRALKNVAQPTALFELVLSQSGPEAALRVDPVCRMSLDPHLAERHVAYRGADYFFCSQHCASAFAEQPSRYTRRRTSREHLLISDDARERAAGRVRHAYTHGGLPDEDLELRVTRIYGASTRGDLQTVTHDLPRRARRAPLIIVLWRWVTRPVRRRRRDRAVRRQLR